jgi:hypothetical protein
MGSVAEWSKALDLSLLLDSQWGKPARVRTSPLPVWLFFPKKGMETPLSVALRRTLERTLPSILVVWNREDVWSL